MKSSEGNILSFRILINRSGDLVTELSGVPDKDLNKCFKNENDLLLVRKIIREAKPKLEKLHSFLESELDSMITTT